MCRTPASFAISLAIVTGLSACASAPEGPAEPAGPIVETDPVAETEPVEEADPVAETEPVEEAAPVAETEPSVFGEARLVVLRNDPDAPMPGPALYLMRMDGTGAEQLPGPVLGEPRWSPDGDRLVVTSGNALAVMDRDGSVRPYVPGSWPSWSPDGTRIAFHRDGDIHVLDLESGEAKCLGPTVEWEGQPAWLPDGRIAFARRRYEGEIREQARANEPLPTEACQERLGEPAVGYASAELGVLDPETGDAEVLPGGTDFVHHLAAAPDSPRLAYMNEEGDIVVLHIGDAASETVVSMDGLAQFPRFGPEGRLIIFISGNPTDLYVLDLTTGAIEAITSDDAYNNMVDIRD